MSTYITATTNSSSDVIPLICKQNSQDYSNGSNNEPRFLSTDQRSSRSSSNFDNPASPVNRGRLASVRKEKESSRRHQSRSRTISGNTNHQDQDFKKVTTTVTRNQVTSYSKSRADNKE